MREISLGSATIEDYRAQLEIALSENAQLRAQNEKPAAKKSKREFVFTPFQAARVMNEERAKLGLEKVAPQMLYNYARKGKFGISVSADGRKQVEIDSFYAWMRIFNAKNS
jgi:hypothetical protein